MNEISCECVGDDYKGCLRMPNSLYICYKTDGTIDRNKACLGDKMKGDDGIEGWTRGCGSLSFQTMRERMTKWCNKLYQEGIYDNQQRQECLDNIDVGNVVYSKAEDSDNKDKGGDKDIERIYAYYQKGKEKVFNYNPSKKPVKDDFQKMMLYSYLGKLYLVIDNEDNILVDNSPENVSGREWTIVSLGKNDMYGIKSAKTGKYLSASDKNELYAKSSSIGKWAQWKMIKYNDNYAFLSVAHNKYLGVSDDGNNITLILRNGMNDLNLWLLKEKPELTGAYITKFDNKDLKIRKSEIMNNAEFNYRLAIEHKFKRDNLKNKQAQLGYLREKQREYLINIAENKIGGLTTRKENLVDENEVISNEFQKAEDQEEAGFAVLQKQYKSECEMSKECLTKALEYVKPSTRGTDLFNRSKVIERNNKIKADQKECNWNDDQVNKIIARRFVEPSDDYCKNLRGKLEEMGGRGSNNEVLIGEIGDIKNKMDSNITEIENINYQLAELELFKTDVNDMFNNLILEEKKELEEEINKEEEERLTSMSEFRKYENEMNAFIKELSSGNLKLEQKISGMIEEIDMDLHENNNIELNLLKNNDYSEKGNKAVKTIVDENLGLLKNKLATARNDYYISILMIVILGLFIIYVGYETYNRYIL